MKGGTYDLYAIFKTKSVLSVADIATRKKVTLSKLPFSGNDFYLITATKKL